MPLSARQLRFAHEYAVDLDAGAAYLRAGYHATSIESARAAACRLLTNVNVQEEIARKQRERSERLNVTADDVMRGLWREATLAGENSSHSARVSALSWLGKAFAMFTDRHEHAFPDDEADAALEAELQRLVSGPAGANGHPQEPPRRPGGPPPNGRAGG